jgi:hypothetical protein
MTPVSPRWLVAAAFAAALSAAPACAQTAVGDWHGELAAPA